MVVLHPFNDDLFLPKLSPPLVGEDEGEGEESFLSTPTPAYRQAGSPSPIERGRGYTGEISNIFG